MNCIECLNYKENGNFAICSKCNDKDLFKPKKYAGGTKVTCYRDCINRKNGNYCTLLGIEITHTGCLDYLKQKGK